MNNKEAVLIGIVAFIMIIVGVLSYVKLGWRSVGVKELRKLENRIERIEQVLNIDQLVKDKILKKHGIY